MNADAENVRQHRNQQDTSDANSSDQDPDNNCYRSCKRKHPNTHDELLLDGTYAKLAS
jgi:hypothetical protein